MSEIFRRAWTQNYLYMEATSPTTRMTQIFPRSLDILVVKKLRLVFFVILAILSIAFLIGGRQLANLSVTQNQAINYAVPALVYSQEIATQLVRFSEISTELRSQNSYETIKEKQSELDSVSNYIQEILEQVESRFGDSYIELEKIEAEFNLLNNIRQGLVAKKLTIQKSKTEIERLSRQLANLRERFETSLEPALLHSMTQYEATLAHLSTAQHQSAVNDNLRTTLQSQGEQQFDLTELTFRVANLLERAETISETSDSKMLNELRALLEYKSLGVSHLLINLEDEVLRNYLAKLTKELRSLCLDEHGILAASMTLSKNQEFFQQLMADQVRLIARITKFIQSNVRTQQAQTLESTADFYETLRTTKSTLLGLSLTILAITVFVVRNVVEKQLNRRMTTLTESVNAIAEGNVEHPVAIDGKDEIGQMAKALEVFKATDRDLRRSNRELEQFAYAASHDLKSPLTSIKTLAGWIEEDADGLSEEAKENLDLLIRRIDRLATLQNDLLEFAKAGHSEEHIETLNIQEMIHSLCELLGAKSHFEITVLPQEPMVIRTNAVPLRQVMLNLINNAIKHHDKPNGVITITANLKHERLLFEIEDDGPGIDPQYHKEVFGLFTTLAPKDKVEGSGLGLSLVQKLVERYNGSISIESPSGARGCIFRCAWPVFPHNSPV